MTSYLVDAILLVALVLSSYRMAIIHRDIKRFRRHQNGYERALSKTSEALVDVGRAIQAINVEGVATVNALSLRIEEGYMLLGQLEKSFAQEQAQIPSKSFNEKAAADRRGTA